MDTLSRRRFLLASGVTGATALVAGAAAVTPRTLAGRAVSDPLPDDARVLVLVTLYGGNDGLNTVIPYADPAYHDARPDLAYEEKDVHPLGDGLGLNPALKGLASLWTAKQLAVVRGVGYPQPDFSHFRSMDIWQTASPSTPVASGWIGRWLDATGDDPVRALNVGSVLPPAAVGSRCTAAAVDASGGGRLATQFASAVTSLGRAASGERPDVAAVRTSYRNERTVAKAFGPVLGAGSGAAGGSPAATAPAKARASARAATAASPPTRWPISSTSSADASRRRCRRASTSSASAASTPTPTRRPAQERLLTTFDTAVTAFLHDLAGDAAGRQVVLAAYSEFGRRAAANASQGTDHGTAGPMFVAGAPVRGGFYGEQPSLTDLADGNLKSNVDFRAVYGELLHRGLGTDPSRVLDTVPKELGLL